MRSASSALRNWGRWGAEDERGTLNLITPERLVAAGALVRKGKVFDLGIPFDENGPQPGGGRINPVHLMSADRRTQVFPGGFKYADDYIFMPLQGATQWDSLAHVYYDDQLYNGFPSSDVTVVGAIHYTHRQDRQRHGRAGRPARHRPPEGRRLARARLRHHARRPRRGHGRPGWRRGRHRRHRRVPHRMAAVLPRARIAAGVHGGRTRLGQDCCEWLHDRDVAAVCSDNWAIEVLPGEDPEAIFNVHMVLIRDMGMTLGEILDLEELTADCAADGVWEFFFCAPPLKVTKGVGSPINPLGDENQR